MIQSIYVPNAVRGTGLCHLSHEGVTFKWTQEGERYDVALTTVRTGLGGKEVGGWSWVLQVEMSLLIYFGGD